MKNRYLGIDIGGTAAKLGLVDEAGIVLAKDTFPVAFDNYQTPILDTVLRSTDIFLHDQGIIPTDLSGIGISATGQIDTVTGIVAGSGGNIKNWDGTPLKDAFFEKYHLPVTVVNDANCVALGESWVGAAKDASNVIVLTIGTGLGGGIIINDQILLGQFGCGGEIGHFSINSQGLPCTCGNTGCFEQYASMTALIKSVTAYYQEQSPDYLTSHTVNGKTIFDSVQAEDPAICALVTAWIQNIVCGIVSLVHIFNPELVILGGAVSVQEDLFVKKIREGVLEHVMPNFRKDLTIQAAQLGNDAGLIGAVYYLIRSICFT